MLSNNLFTTLLDWYQANKRVLPWRGEPTPYEVWVSEIMLQQTRVETVKEYYIRWMKTFPTIFDLANSNEETVLKMWEGLGYYSRARNLHKAAKIVVDLYHGELPNDKNLLMKLPGIGEYTAGAILSIAFGKSEPAVDGNVLRVISRITADDFDITKNETKSLVAQQIRPYMLNVDTSDFTQALFELGALICLPNDDYRCEKCPVSLYCQAYNKNKQSEFPVKVNKKEKKLEKLTVFLLIYNDKIAIKKRSEKGLLASLYEFPNKTGFYSEKEVATLYDGKIYPLPDSSHVFTHIIWEMKGYYIELKSKPNEDDLILISFDELENKYSIPSAFSVYKGFLKNIFIKN